MHPYEHNSPAPESNWFERWFASDYYLKLYSHRDDREAELCVALILRATGLDKQLDRNPRALDLASGPGRHSLAMARHGLKVTGVDLSPTLLQHSRAEAAAAGLQIDFRQADMRRIAFRDEFDLVAQLFTSFGYFESADEDMRVLEAVRRALRPGGWYALDLMNDRYLRDHLVPRSYRELDGERIIEERWLSDGRVNKRISIEHGNDPLHFTESVHLFEKKEIEEMLREAKLEPAFWFGDYDGSAFDPESSRRMLVIAQAGEE